MKKVKKKILSFILMLTLCISMMPISNIPAYAEEINMISSGTCGDNLTWELANDGTLTISGIGKMQDGSINFGGPWNTYNNLDVSHEIKVVKINSGVTSIGNHAFLNCRKLESIEIPESVTSIGDYAFLGCYLLTNIKIPKNVTHIGDGAFLSCNFLKSIEIPESITSIGDVTFSNCRNLMNIEMPEGITSIGSGAFSNCRSLRSIKIPESVTSIGSSAFRECKSLIDIEIPDGVVSIQQYVFADCSNLTSIRMPKNVISIENAAFSNCTNLADFEIPSSVTSISSSAFSGCRSLTSIEIPLGVTWLGSRTFADCVSLISVDIPSSVTEVLENVFDGCSSLLSIKILNPNCALSFANETTFPEHTTIYGYANSTAQKYAEKYDRTFVTLDLDDIQGLVKKFTIDSSAYGSVNKIITAYGSLTLSDNVETALETLKEIDNIKWVSSDPSIAEVTACNGTVYPQDHHSASFYITITPHKEGKTIITGITSDGETASCTVRIDEEVVLTTCHVTGTLKEVNRDLLTVTIGDTEYAITKHFDISKAYNILLNGNCKTVVAVLQNDKVSQMDMVIDAVVPKVTLSLEQSSVSYQNGKFDKSKMDIIVSLTCGAKLPYRDIDLKGTEAEDISVNFSEYKIELPEYLKFRFLFSSSHEAVNKDTATVKYGENKNYIHTMYIDDEYIPEQVKESFTISVTATFGDKFVNTETSLAIANIDKQQEIAETKKTNKQLSEANSLMDKITFLLHDDLMDQAGYSKQQKESVKFAIKAWIADILSTQILVSKNEDNSIWTEFCKKAGINKSDFLTKIAEKAFKQLGVDISGLKGFILQWENRTASTEIRVFKNNKKYDTITVNLNFLDSSYTGNQSFVGIGNIKYKIKTTSGNTYKSSDEVIDGTITFHDMKKLCECVQDICMSELEKIYDMDIGNNLDKGANWIRKLINNTTESKILEALTSDIVNKIMEKKYGSFSDNVFKLYTNSIQKKTNGTVSCPVDVYIYDSQGTLCGSIIDNEISTDNGEIFLYCVGDQKYFSLTGDDYTIQLIGNDEGTMTYKIDEYLGTELLRSITYENVPLQEEKTYYGLIPETQLLDSEVYNLISLDDAEMILPTSDIIISDDNTNDSGDTDTGNNSDSGNDSDNNDSDSEDNSNDDNTSNSENNSNTGTGSGNSTNFGAGSSTNGNINSSSNSTTGNNISSGNSSNIGNNISSGNNTNIGNNSNTGNDISSGSNPSTENNNVSDNKPGVEVVNISNTVDIALSKTSYVYNGKERKPDITVKVDSVELIKGTDYTLSYENNIDIGTVSVVITGIGKYAGTVTKTFTIIPKGTTILGKIVAKKRGFTVKWKKQDKSTTGYQVQYSTSKKFAKKAVVVKTVKKTKTTKLNIKKIKTKKKYYVRVRTYKTVNGKKYYSNWSKVKNVTTKK